MQMPQHSADAKDRLRRLVGDAPGVRIGPMFGSVGAFVHGHMFAAVFGDTVGVKLDAAALPELLGLPGAGPFLPGRPMREWAALPADMPDAEASAWCGRALAHVAALPPKAGRGR